MDQGTATATGQASGVHTDAPHRATTLDSFWQDVCFGARVLYRQPTFSVIAILTLALGIGANTAIFSVVNAALLTPIAIPDPGRVGMLWTDKLSQGSVAEYSSIPDFLDCRASGIFEKLAGFTSYGFNLLVGKNPQRVEAASVTAEWFEILQTRPYLGRLFRAEDMQPGHDRVAILSYGLWASRFSSDPAVVGQSTIINSVPYTVIGVLPKKVARLGDEEMYVPLVFEPPLSNERFTRFVTTVGRLAPNVSFRAAQSGLTALSERLARQYPIENGSFRFRLQPIEDAYIEDVHRLLWVLFGAVAFVLLIACANIANLLLVRGAARQKEIAIRAALGADRARLIRQLLTESVILSLLGGLVGLIPGSFGVRLLMKIKPEALPNADLVHLNPAVMLFTVVVAVGTGLVFGALPAWQAWRANANAPLRERSQASGRELRFGNILVVAEMALTLVLVTGAVLMLRSFVQMRSAYPGYDAQRVLTMRISLSGKQYEAPEKQILFYKELLSNLEQLPGVRRAAAIDTLPTSDDVLGGTLHFTDRPEARSGEAALVVISSVSPDFFDSMRIPLVRGRFFSEADGPAAPLAVILDQGTAKQYWPERDPIGQVVRLRLGSPLRKIVGVVGNIDRSIAAKFKTRVGQAYVPFAQSPNPKDLPNPETSLVISCETDPLNLVRSVRRVISSLAPDQPVFQVRTMADARAAGQVSTQFGTSLLSVFAGLSLLLAALGIYGVISYSIEQRTREIGVRMALGATAKDLLLAALAKGLLITLIGLAAGMAGALVITRTMGSLLHGLSAIDPTSFCVAAVTLVIVSLAATYIPAYRASRIEPMKALRDE